MKKSVLLVTLALISPIAYSAGEVEEGPPGIGCAGCANNQSMWDEYNRQQMNSAAAYAEAQRAMQAQIEAQVAADRKRAQEADQARQKQEERQDVCKMQQTIKRVVLKTLIVIFSHTTVHVIGWLPGGQPLLL